MKHAHENHSHSKTAKGAAAGLSEKNAPISERYPNLYQHIRNLLEDAYDVKPSSIIESAQFSEMGLSVSDVENIVTNIEITISHKLPAMTVHASIASLMEKTVARTGSRDIQ